MGIIAERQANAPEQPPAVKRNKVDRILDRLDDDDRSIVHGWLCDLDMGEETLEAELFAVGIVCSDSTIRRWRRANGITWA